MQDLKAEFEAYLDGLVKSYPKGLKINPRDISSLNPIAEKAKEFNAMANQKLLEMSKTYGIELRVLKIEMSLLMAKYNGKLLSGNL